MWFLIFGKYYEHAMYVIFKACIFSTIGNTDNSTYSDCLPIRQKLDTD